MKATIKDVARIAQVSPSTVSRALRDNPRISEEVRARVKQVAQELDFHPNQMARSLVNRQTRIVGVLFPGSAAESMGHPFYPAVLQGMGAVAGQRRYHMLLSTGADNMSADEAIRSLAESGYVSGIVCLATTTAGQGEPFPSLGLPVVELGHPRNPATSCYVDNDNVLAGYDSTRYLLERGHKRVLFLGYDSAYTVTVDRRAGYEKALREAGLPIRESWVVHSRFIENTTDYSLLRELFTAPDRPTAVVGMDDTLAVSLLYVLNTLGLTCPADVSVVSFNNTAVGQYNLPPLTSVDVNPCELGEKAMTLMLDLVKGRAEAPARMLAPFRLIERGSVAELKEKE